MEYFRLSTDASNIYRPSTSAERSEFYETSVIGNLADILRSDTYVSEDLIKQAMAVAPPHIFSEK